MPGFLEFLTRLCDEGEVLLRERPRVDESEKQEAQSFLNQLHADAVLELAGPELAFLPEIALAAAELTWTACWFLVNHEEMPERVEPLIKMPRKPGSAACHLSADLTLRYLAQIHQRSYARSIDDVLTTRLSSLLREWPLGGVLSSVTEAPTTALDFYGHVGLMMFYAERWTQNPRQLWRGEGSTAEYCTWFGSVKENA